jgi:hypothetical protein
LLKQYKLTPTLHYITTDYPNKPFLSVFLLSSSSIPFSLSFFFPKPILKLIPLNLLLNFPPLLAEVLDEVETLRSRPEVEGFLPREDWVLYEAGVAALPFEGGGAEELEEDCEKFDIIDEDITFGEGLVAGLEMTRGGVGEVVLVTRTGVWGVLTVGAGAAAGVLGAGAGEGEEEELALAAIAEGAGGGGLGEVGDVRKFCDAERDLGGGGGIFLGFCVSTGVDFGTSIFGDGTEGVEGVKPI